MAFEGTQASAIILLTFSYTDKKGLAESATNATAKKRQQYFREVFKRMLSLIEIRWISSHTGIPGNDLAGKAAKEAASTQAGNAPNHIRTQAIKAYVKRQVERVTRCTWANEWATLAHRQHSYWIYKTPSLGLWTASTTHREYSV
jgi:hypothetical protein